jgi:hypothetical protein
MKIRATTTLLLILTTLRAALAADAPGRARGAQNAAA